MSHLPATLNPMERVMEDEVLDDEEEMEEIPVRRGPPRFGSFVTIAAAILLLFGAASRIGKVEETIAYITGIDRLAENRIKQEEARLQTAVMLGAVPVSRGDLRPAPGTVPINTQVRPRQRPEVDPEAIRNPVRPPLNAGAAADGGDYSDDGYDAYEDEGYQEAAPADTRRPSVSAPVQAPASQETSVVVSASDTWFKIAQRTLGNGARWQEIMNANPSARNGLRPGMRLVIPR